MKLLEENACKSITKKDNFKNNACLHSYPTIFLSVIRKFLPLKHLVNKLIGWLKLKILIMKLRDMKLNKHWWEPIEKKFEKFLS